MSAEASRHPEPGTVFERMAKVDVSHLSELFDHTPLEYYGQIDDVEGKELWVLREDLQSVTDKEGTRWPASFKVRGAEAEVSHNLSAIKDNITFSSAGNAGLAYTATALRHGVDVYGGVPLDAPRAKTDPMEALGIKKIFRFDDIEFATQSMHKMARMNGGRFVHPFNSPAIIKGQSTIVHHVARLAAQKDMQPSEVLAASGGASLTAGLLLGFDELQRHLPWHNKTLITAVEAEGNSVLDASLTLGQPAVLDQVDRFSDGTAVKEMGDTTFHVVNTLRRHHPFRNRVVSRVALEYAMVIGEELLGRMPEPAGAHGLAAYLESQEPGNKVVICSGSNIDPAKADEVRRNVARRAMKSKPYQNRTWSAVTTRQPIVDYTSRTRYSA